MKKIVIGIILLSMLACGNKQSLNGRWYAYSYAIGMNCYLEVNTKEIHLLDENHNAIDTVKYDFISKGIEDETSYIIIQTEDTQYLSFIYNEDSISVKIITDLEHPFEGFIRFQLSKEDFPLM